MPRTPPAFLLVLLAGCSLLDRAPAVPEDRLDDATVPGMPNVRFWGDVAAPAFIDMLQRAVERELAYLAENGDEGELPPAALLAISGGGQDGAFGAGLLKGWTEAGDRPAFKGITGISTGAMIAPLAFAGPEYDDVLEEMYTTLETKDVVVKRPILDILASESAARSTPLQGVLRLIVDDALLERVAEEYAKGRVLLIGTTNLDAERPVIWDMGAIASSDHPEAPELFRSVMLASASIPGAFPPVLIDVEVGGVKYQEMHVDGGTSQQVFLYPESVDKEAFSLQMGRNRERAVYIIRNGNLSPKWGEVDRSVFGIAGRSIALLIRQQGIGDLYRLYLEASHEDLAFHLAHIPADFESEPEEQFDPKFMRALFDLGYGLAKDGYPWADAPPGFE